MESDQSGTSMASVKQMGAREEIESGQGAVGTFSILDFSFLCLHLPSLPSAFEAL